MTRSPFSRPGKYGPSSSNSPICTRLELRPGSSVRISAGSRLNAPSSRATSRFAGLIENLARRSALHDAAFAQHEHLVAQLEAFVQIVRDQQHGRFEIRADLAQHVVELGAQRSVQALRGLVEQQQLRRADQRACDGAALALASGNLVRAPAGGFGQAEALRAFRSPGDAAPGAAGAPPRTPDSRAGSCAGTARSSETRSRSCAPAAEGARRVAPSNRISSSSRMRPSSGRTKPAIESSTMVLPAPLGPNSTVTPAGGLKFEVERKSGRVRARREGLANAGLDHALL